jgi:putative inorganic carbon (HCO3(-)) transporter
MSLLHRWSVQQPLLRGKLPLLLLAVMGLSTALGLVAARQPVLAIGVVIAALLAVAVLAWPDTATLVVIFVLYTNAAVVAVRFHGVPNFFAAVFPLILMLPLSSYLIFRREKLIVTPVLPLLFLYLLVQVAGTLPAEYIGVATSTVIGYAIEGLGLYLLITNVVRTPTMLRWAIWTLLLAGSFLGFLSLYQQMTGTFNNLYGGFAQINTTAFDTGVQSIQGAVTQHRLGGPLGDQNYYAQFMLMLVAIGFFRFWAERSTILRAAALTATGLCAMGAILTFSRGAAVGFVLMIAIMTFMRYIKPYQVVMFLLAAILGLTVFPQYATRLKSLEGLSDVANQGSGGIAEADSSVQSRASEMLTAGLVFVDHPMLGVGPGTYKYYYPEYSEYVGLRSFHTTQRAAHDMYLGLAAETGALGLMCFVLIVFVTMRSLAQLRRRCLGSHPEFANMLTGFLIAIASYMTTGLFLSFAYERFFWLILALAGATIHVVETTVLQDVQLADTEPAGRVSSGMRLSH